MARIYCTQKFVRIAECFSRDFLKLVASFVRSAVIVICYNKAGLKSFLTINDEFKLEGNS